MINEVVLDGVELAKLLRDERRFDALARTLYAELDADGSGSLSRAEVGPAVATLGLEVGLPPRAVAARAPGFQRLLRDAFDALDVDRDGALSLPEYKVLLAEMLARLRDGMQVAPVRVRVVRPAERRAFDVASVVEDFYRELGAVGAEEVCASQVDAWLARVGERYGFPPAFPGSSWVAVHSGSGKSKERDPAAKLSKDQVEQYLEELLSSTIVSGEPESMR